MFAFGAGIIWATPTHDSTGAAIANPSPIMLGTLQEGSLEITEELKPLYGSKKYPVDIASGKASIKGTAKAAEFSADLFNTLFFGLSVSTSNVGVAGSTVAKTVAATLTITPPSAGTFVGDLGVVDSKTGKSFVRVSETPATGQYAVDVSTGQYTFATADVGAVVYINYKYTSEAIKGRAIDIQNDEMGYKPRFSIDWYMQRDGKTFVVQLNACISESLKMAFKQDDFAIPEFAYQAMADAAGHVGKLQIVE